MAAKERKVEKNLSLEKSVWRFLNHLLELMENGAMKTAVKYITELLNLRRPCNCFYLES